MKLLLVLLAVILGNVVSAFSQTLPSFSLHPKSDFDSFKSANPNYLAAAEALKSWNYQPPSILLAKKPPFVYSFMDVAWTNGERAFSFSITPQGVATFSLENQGGGMDTVTLSVPFAPGNMKTVWFTVASVETQTASLHIDNVNGIPVAAYAPFASSDSVNGAKAVEMWSFDSNTLTINGWIHDPSNPTSTKITAFDIYVYNVVHMPEPTSTLLLACGALALACRRKRA